MLKEKVLTQLNNLPTEIKIPVARTLQLMERTEELMHKNWGDYDLSAQLALKDELRGLERTIKQLSKGKVNEKLLKSLELGTRRLQTLSENILHWTFEE